MPRPLRTPRVRLPFLAVASSLVLAGCGGDEESSDLASLVPPDTPFFMEATVKPEGDRADAIEALTSAIGGIDDPGGQVVAQLDASLQAEGGNLSYADDIEPWLGERGAFFVRSLERSTLVGGMVDAGYMVDVTDADAAQDFIDSIPEASPDNDFEDGSYEGVDYLSDTTDAAVVGLVGDVMVAGTEDSFKAAVDASEGESLADADDFSDQVGGLDDDKLAEMWLDLGTALDAAAESSGADGTEIDAARAALGPLLDEPLALSLGATEETITLDSSAAGGDGIGGDTALLQQLPADAWAALAVADAGDALRESLTGLGSLGAELGDPSLDPEAIFGAIEAQTGLDLEEDVFSWVGDVGAYVSGTSEASFSAGTLIEAVDASAASQALAAVGDAFQQAAEVPIAEPLIEGAEAGFSAEGPDGEAIELALRDDIVVGSVSTGGEAVDVLDPAETLADSDAFEAASDAVGSDFEAAAYVAIQDFLVVAEKGDDGDTDYDAARPYTQALDYLILGTATDDERDLNRLVLGVSE